MDGAVGLWPGGAGAGRARGDVAFPRIFSPSTDPFGTPVSAILVPQNCASNRECTRAYSVFVSSTNAWHLCASNPDILIERSRLGREK